MKAYFYFLILILSYEIISSQQENNTLNTENILTNADLNLIEEEISSIEDLIKYYQRKIELL